MTPVSVRKTTANPWLAPAREVQIQAKALRGRAAGLRRVERVRPGATAQDTLVSYEATYAICALEEEAAVLDATAKTLRRPLDPEAPTGPSVLLWADRLTRHAKATRPLVFTTPAAYKAACQAQGLVTCEPVRLAGGGLLSLPPSYAPDTVKELVTIVPDHGRLVLAGTTVQLLLPAASWEFTDAQTELYVTFTSDGMDPERARYAASVLEGP